MLTSPSECHVITPEEYGVFEAFLDRNGLNPVDEWDPETTKLRQPIVVACKDTDIVGCSRMYRSWLHPLRWRIAIHVTPHQRRQVIGTSLFAESNRRLPGDTSRDVQASISATNAQAVAFLKASGFEPLMTTRIGVLKHDAVMKNSLRSQIPDSIRIVTLAQKPELCSNIAHVHDRVYRDQHLWNPPVPLNLAQKRDLFLDPNELMPEHQFIALYGETPVGVASLRRLPVANECDFGWIGVVDLPDHLAIHVHASLWSLCLTAAHISRLAIHFEIDLADRLSTLTSNELPIEWEPDWLTFHR